MEAFERAARLTARLTARLMTGPERAIRESAALIDRRTNVLIQIPLPPPCLMTHTYPIYIAGRRTRSTC